MAESTLKATDYRLRFLAKHIDLDDPEAVKTFICRLGVANSYKNNLAKSYDRYVKINGLMWEQPYFRPEERLPKVPSKEAVKKLIAGSSRKYATIFTLLAETGAMPIELHKVTLRDIDLERGAINLPGCKGHSPRKIKLKSGTVAMLRTYLSRHSGDQPFPEPVWMGKCFRWFRDRLAAKLQDPTLKRIRLYDLRHYFGTITYHRTKDILYTKQQMGHKKIETTLIYTQLVDFGEEEWISAVAKTVEEACKLVDAGFEYVCNFKGAKIFRKRK